MQFIICCTDFLKLFFRKVICHVKVHNCVIHHACLYFPFSNSSMLSGREKNSIM